MITLTTDFGTDSPYVAEIKAAIVSVARDARIIDITHAIPPQDIFQAAIVLADVSPRFPPGTIHVAVVNDSAEERLQVGVGQAVVVSW